MIRNPFQSAGGAARYAAGRPYIHPLFMERLKPWQEALAGLRSATHQIAGR